MLRRSAQFPSQRIVGFIEDVKTKDSIPDVKTSLARSECDLEELDAVSHIEPLSASGAEQAPSLLVVTATGKVEVRSADLQRVQQRFNVSNSPEGFKLELVALQTAGEADKGLLKERPDLLASLGPAESAADSTRKDAHLLLIISSSGAASDKAGYMASIWVVSGPSSSSTQPLETWHLPGSSDIPHDAGSTFAMESVSGTLYRLSERRLAAVKLSTTATVNTAVQLPSSGPYQVLPLSKTALLLSHHGSILVYDSRYGCMYSARNLSAGATSSDRKRKRALLANEATNIPTQIITWLPKTNTVVILHGRDCLTFHVTLPKKRSRLVEPRLVDAFARGISTGTGISNRKVEPALLARMDELIATKKVKHFDVCFSELTSALPEGHPSKRYYDQILASKALTATFGWDKQIGSTSDRGIKSSIFLKLAPKRALEWLSSNGYLTSGHISKALHHERTSNDETLRAIYALDVVGALAKHDSSLTTLAAFTNSTSYQPLEGWVESLRYFMTSFEGQAPSRSRSDFPSDGATPEQPPSRKAPRNRDEDPDQEQAYETVESSLANTDLDLALSLLDPEHAQRRGQALRQILTRLGICYAPSTLTSAFRSQLAHNDTLLLIDLLRIELAHSGWTGRQLDKPSLSEGGIDPADEAIHLIAKLLNCCVDALGIGGWLGLASDSQPAVLGIDGGVPGSDKDLPDTQANSNKEVLTHLRHATTSSLEAAQESAFFANFLTDFMRYNVNIAAADAQDRKQKRARINRAVPSDAGPEANMLPLGPKSVEPVSQYRVDAGGEVKERSARDIARKESRKLGTYTFERIRV